MAKLPKFYQSDSVLQNSEFGELARHLGFVVIVWGLVEDATRELLDSVALIGERNTTVRTTVLSMTPFRGQIDILRRTAFIHQPDSDWFKELDAVLSEIEGKLHEQRNRFIHDPWVEDDDGKIVRTARGKLEVSVSKDKKGNRSLKILEPKPATLAEITDFLDKAYACYHKLIQSRRDYLVWLVASDARPAWFDDVMD